MTTPPRPQFAVRTCRRPWLRAKFHFLVAHDGNWKQELSELLDNIAGRRIEVFELTLALAMFYEDDATGLMSLLMSYLAVPFWQWRRLTRLMKLVNQQLVG